MSRALRTTLIATAAVVGVAAVLLVGMNFGRAWWSHAGFGSWGMMADFGRLDRDLRSYAVGPGMMGSGAHGPGMIGGGMMGSSALFGVEPLTLAQAQEALTDYLAARGDENLEIGEVMIFDNHAYAEIVEADSGIGAMEVLVDPVTLAVYPEHGPNMMWNLKYGAMAGTGMMGGMMGAYGGRPNLSGPQAIEPSDDMPVTPEEAIEAAQRYLDRYLPGTVADEHADRFYGYYTLHILREGETVGMLSVNGYSRQVFLHGWHGDFVEMSEG